MSGFMEFKKHLKNNFGMGHFDDLSFLEKMKYSVKQFSLFFTVIILFASFLGSVDRQYVFDIARMILLIIIVSQYIPLIIGIMFSYFKNHEI